MKLAGSTVRLALADEEAVAQNARRYLAESMGELKGLPQKIGQILSMSDTPGAEDFAPLTGRARPLPFEVIQKLLATEWRRPWRDVLKEIEPEGLAASLGQVHRATLLDGRRVAVKVQYPGIAKALEADLKLLGWFTLPVGGLGRGFNLAGYRAEILRDFGEELDYMQEAEHQHQYFMLARYLPGLVVPEVHGQWTTPRVLVNTWEDGATLADVARDWSESERKAAGRRFVSHTLETLFRSGFTQGDLHPGNFRFRKSPSGEVELVLYDYGCIFRPAMEVRLALLRLIEISEANQSGDPFPCFLAMGFDPDYLEPMAVKLPALSRVLFEPFILDGDYDVDSWQLGKRVAEILGDDRWNFRIAGSPDLILLMRIFHGMLHTLRTLRVAVSWKFLLAPIRKHFREDVKRLALPVAESAHRSFAGMAKHLIIQVRQDGRTKVRLTSPLHTVDHLEQSMDECVLEKVRKRGIDLDVILAGIRSGGYRPQEVFRLDTDGKDVRVWLE